MKSAPSLYSFIWINWFDIFTSRKKIEMNLINILYMINTKRRYLVPLSLCLLFSNRIQAYRKRTWHYTGYECRIWKRAVIHKYHLWLGRIKKPDGWFNHQDSDKRISVLYALAEYKRYAAVCVSGTLAWSYWHRKQRPCVGK